MTTAEKIIWQPNHLMRQKQLRDITKQTQQLNSHRPNCKPAKLFPFPFWSFVQNQNAILKWACIHAEVASTAWCSEIGSLTSPDAWNSGASTDVREPISLHPAAESQQWYDNTGGLHQQVVR